MSAEPLADKRGAPFRSGRIGLGVLFQVLVVALLVALINYLGYHYYWRADFSRSQEFRLATLTKQILRDLTQPARITVYFSPTQAGFETLIARDLNSLLKELQFSGRPHLEVEYVDPTRNLKRAQEVQSLHGFSPADSVLIVEYGGRSRHVPVLDTADFDYTPVAAGDPPRVAAFRGEAVLASALLALLDPREHKVYFLQGHGEPGIGDNSPVSLFVEHVRRQNVTPEPLNLATVGGVPEDAAAVVIVGARYDLQEAEFQALHNYWRGEGRLLVLLDPDADTPNLQKLVAAAGIVPEDTRVLRVVPLQFAIGIVRDVVGLFLDGSDVTKRFVGVNALLPDPVQSLDAAGVPGDPTIQLRPLIEAEEAYWGETEHVTDAEKGVAYDDGIDRGFPVHLAVAAERGAIHDDRVEIGAAKMIVVGNSRFIFDDSVAGSSGTVANLDFAVSSMNWLLDRRRMTGVIPKVPREFQITLTETQLGQIAFYTMVAIPGAAALLGLLVWLRRRK